MAMAHGAWRMARETETAEPRGVENRRGGAAVRNALTAVRGYCPPQDARMGPGGQQAAGQDKNASG